MNYIVTSMSGFRRGAHTEETAKRIADKHYQDWKDLGMEVRTNVFYRDGSLVYIAKGEQRPSLSKEDIEARRASIPSPR